jgi:hypothetical protein
MFGCAGGTDGINNQRMVGGSIRDKYRETFIFGFSRTQAAERPWHPLPQMRKMLSPSPGKLTGGWFMAGWGIGLTWFYHWGAG